MKKDSDLSDEASGYVKNSVQAEAEARAEMLI